MDEEVSDAQMRARLREALHEFAALLNDRERCILEQRLLTEDPLTLREIAHRYGISRQRVKQVESRLLERLRSHLVREMGDHLEPEATQHTGTYAS